MATKTEQTTGLTPSEMLDRHISEVRAEMVRFREEHGNPEEPMRKFMRETFDPEALEQTYREHRRYKGLDLDDEDNADDACLDA